MVHKYSKSEFVRTLLSLRITERLNGRIKANLRYWIKTLHPDKPEMETIQRYIAEGLFRDGLRFISDDGVDRFRIEAARPYIKCNRKCFYKINY